MPPPPPLGRLARSYCCIYRNDDANRYSYAGLLCGGEGGVPRDLPKAVSLFEQLGDEGLLEAKVRHIYI